MIDNFPAAHSMDTEWFALDRDGYLGLFYSDETGAVPVSFGQAFKYQGFEYCLREILPSGPSGELEVTVAMEPVMKLLEAPEALVRHVIDSGRQDATVSYSALFHLRSEEILERIFLDDFAIRFCGERVVAYLEKYKLDEVLRALANGDVLGFRYMGIELELLCQALSLFCYEEEWSDPARPYDRTRHPEKPMHCAHFSQAGRERLAKVTFTDLSFAERETIQPPEHMESDLWWPYSWVGTDGRVHQREEGSSGGGP